MSTLALISFALIMTIFSNLVVEGIEEGRSAFQTFDTAQNQIDQGSSNQNVIDQWDEAMEEVIASSVNT